MPRFLKVLLAALAVSVVGGLVAADWVVSNMGAPSYTHPCDPPRPGASTGSFLVHGFGSGPLQIRGCYAGARLDMDAKVDRDHQTLTVTSSTSLRPFDGDDRHVRVHATRVDHSRDALRFRVLEAVTPFSDLDQTEPYLQDGTGNGPNPWDTADVGLPRLQERADGTTALVINVGSYVDDPSLVLLVLHSSKLRTP